VCSADSPQSLIDHWSHTEFGGVGGGVGGDHTPIPFLNRMYDPHETISKWSHVSPVFPQRAPQEAADDSVDNLLRTSCRG